MPVRGLNHAAKPIAYMYHTARPTNRPERDAARATHAQKNGPGCHTGPQRWRANGFSR